MYKRIGILMLIWAGLLSAKESYAQYTFNNAPIGGGGFVTGIVTHKTSGDRYCRTDVGGAYRWDAANNKWIQLLDWINESENGFIGVESLALDPQNANNVYMLCGTSYINGGRTAILKSTDKGNTFTYTDVTSKFKAHGNGNGRGNGERLAVDPKNSNILFCGTRANGLWKSTDAGVTWNQAWNGVTTTTNGNGICFVLFDTTSSVVNGVTQTIYIGVSRIGSSNIYKSTDGGSSFTDISATTSFMPHRAALQETTMYVTYSDNEGPVSSGGFGKLYKLNTSTGVWSNVTPVHWQDYPYGGVSIDPANVDRVVISTCGMYWNNQFGTGWGDFIFLSTDGGSTWTLKNGTNATYDANGMEWTRGGAVNWMDCIEFDQSNTNIVRVIGGGGVYTCPDITATNPSWKCDVIGLEETAFLDGISIPGGPLITSFGDVSGFVHEPLTSYPSKKLSPAGGYNNHSIAYAAGNTSKVVRIGNGEDVVYFSTNMGSTWTGCTTNKGSAGRGAISADGGTILHCPGGASTTYYTTNDGESWSGCSGVSLGDAIPVADQVNSNYFYIYNPTNGQMLRSSNKGVSFSVAGTPGGTTAYHPWEPTLIRTVPGKEGHVWVPLGRNGLKYSTNYGATYTTVSNVTYCKSIGMGKAMSGSGYPTIFIWGKVSGVTGLFRSTDQGVTWLRINDDAHQYAGAPFLIGDMNVFGRVIIGTGGGRGVVYAQIQDCNGEWGGTAYLDSCLTCVGGTTGKLPCVKDCQGIWGGSDTLSCTKDCQGIWGGGAFVDSCGTCVEGTTGKQACIKDCNGVWNGTAYKDSCEICVGGNTGKTACIKDCNGDWGGTAFKDSCDNCVGGNTGNEACVKDCNNVWGGTAYLDSCQTCVGGTTGKLACAKDCNGIWGGPAFIDICANCIDTTKGEKPCITNVNDYQSNTFSFSPNPFTHSLQLQLLKPSEYTIINTSGETVESGFCQNNCNIATILHPGLYFLTIKNTQAVETIKIIKNR